MWLDDRGLSERNAFRADRSGLYDNGCDGILTYGLAGEPVRNGLKEARHLLRAILSDLSLKGWLAGFARRRRATGAS